MPQAYARQAGCCGADAPSRASRSIQGVEPVFSERDVWQLQAALESTQGWEPDSEPNSQPELESEPAPAELPEPEAAPEMPQANVQTEPKQPGPELRRPDRTTA